MKVIIVGGVAGGASAAARIRRLDENAEILVFERSGYVSYANCGLPYYIGGVITDREKLTLQTPESFYKRFQIQVKVHHEVAALHPERKTVTVKNLETGEEFEESYDKLILSPGAKPPKIYRRTKTGDGSDRRRWIYWIGNGGKSSENRHFRNNAAKTETGAAPSGWGYGVSASRSTAEQRDSAEIRKFRSRISDRRRYGSDIFGK